MRKVFLLLLVLCLGCSSYAAPPEDYEGFGSVTRGHLDAPGGYDTVDVNNLNDSGAGSFREAMGGQGKDDRLVTFSVGGTITLASSLYIQSSYLTIDGETAPDPGITIIIPNNQIETQLMPVESVPVHDVIMRYLRFDGNCPPGDATGAADIFSIYGAHELASRIIFDHITATNSDDGIFDMTNSVNDVTISWCLIKDTEVAVLLSYGKRERISLHHNLFARNNERQPYMTDETSYFDMVNNVIYGWGWIENGDHGLWVQSDAAEATPNNVNVENNVFHLEDGGTGYGDADNAIMFVGGGDIGTFYFNGNVVPNGEGNNVSTGSQFEIAEANQVTMYDANTLGNTVVPYVGTHYPTQDEIDLLDAASKAIGGDGYPPPEEGTYLVANIAKYRRFKNE